MKLIQLLVIIFLILLAIWIDEVGMLFRADRKFCSEKWWHWTRYWCMKSEYFITK